MAENFMLCVNGIIPIFLLIGLGIALKAGRVVDEPFCETANGLVFKLVLPVMIFYDIISSDIGANFSPRVLLAAVIAMLVSFFTIWGITLLVTKDNKKRAAFSQCSHRTNYAILGLPLTRALFGDAAAANATVILAVSMVMQNMMSVIYLEMFLNRGGGLKSTFLSILKNPIIIASVSGSVLYLLGIRMPKVLDTSLLHISRMCVPLSLITIGASMHYENIRKTMGLAVLGSFIKALFVPLLFLPLGILCGFRGENLGVLFIFLASPSAVAGYAMTRQAGGDYELSGNIIMLSTAISFFVVFFGTLCLKTIGLL